VGGKESVTEDNKPENDLGEVEQYIPYWCGMELMEEYS
jgi:hypothetical protein